MAEHFLNSDSPWEEADAPWATRTEQHEFWRRAQRDRRTIEEIITEWAEKALAAAKLPSKLAPYILRSDRAYKVATLEEVEEMARQGAIPYDLPRLVEALGSPYEAVMAAHALERFEQARRSIEFLHNCLDPKGQIELMNFFDYVFVLGIIYAEVVAKDERPETKTARDAGRKEGLKRARLEVWDKEFARAEELRAQGKKEREQARIIAEETGRSQWSIKDRLRKQRGTAPRRRNKKSG
jgi:hypothetical protein